VFYVFNPALAPLKPLFMERGAIHQTKPTNLNKTQLSTKEKTTRHVYHIIQEEGNVLITCVE
jgi:hypothetical protein